MNLYLRLVWVWLAACFKPRIRPGDTPAALRSGAKPAARERKRWLGWTIGASAVRAALGLRSCARAYTWPRSAESPAGARTRASKLAPF